MTRITILTVGDELLNGQTTDTNTVWLGTQLNNIGCQVTSRLSVGDDIDEIRKGLDFAFANAEVVIMTGGLGPTKDDITKKALVQYFDDELRFHQETYDRIVDYFSKTGRKPTEAHRIQSYMPSQAILLQNNRGTAPGMWMKRGEQYLISVPGVPTEMRGIFEDHVLQKISELTPDYFILHHVLQTAGLGETYIAEKIDDIIQEFPDNMSIAYLPGLGSVKLRLTTQGDDELLLRSRLENFAFRIRERINGAIYAEGKKSIEKAVGEMALAKDLTIGTAESCTGGHVGHLITSIPGSSAYFKGSIVAYDNEVKQNILEVPTETLDTYGAVSEETVIAMVQGGLKKLKTDVMIAVSGIAGPTGGSAEKPVGTIWVAVGNAEKVITKKFQLSKNRLLNIKYTSILALNELRLFMVKI